MVQYNDSYMILHVQDKNGYHTYTINFNELPIFIGRGANLCIEGTYVSSTHGKFDLKDQQLIYEDFSKNGTFINGRAVHQCLDKTMKIQPHDKIILASNVQNRFHDFPCIIVQQIKDSTLNLERLRKELEYRLFYIYNKLKSENKSPVLHGDMMAYINHHTQTLESAKKVLDWSDDRLLIDAYNDGLLSYDLNEHLTTNITPLNQDYINPNFDEPIYQLKIIKDNNNTPIQLTDNNGTYDLEELGEGGTASVYQYRKDGEFRAVKLYHDPVLSKHRTEYYDKLQTMLKTKPEGIKINVDGQEYTQFVWPEILVYDNDGLAGYAMQVLPKSNLYQLNTYLRNIKSLDKNHHSIAYRIQVARNLAVAVANLHKAGHYFIDVKPENIFVFKDKCAVCFIDCDGFSIQQGKYPARHYSKGYQAPFVLINQLTPVHLSSEPYQDYYCLAHLIFQILDFGNLPFSIIVNDKTLEDEILAIGDSYDYKVEKNLYPYHLNQRNDILPSHKSTFRSWPIGLRKLFDLAFSGTKESLPTAVEWAKELGIYIKNQDFEKCRVQPDNFLHHHFKGMPCPICAIENGHTQSVAQSNSYHEPLSRYPSVDSAYSHALHGHSAPIIAKKLDFDSVESFSEGLAAVNKNSKWGYIDKTGRVVIGFEYGSAGDFSDGLAHIKKNGKWGYIDKTGRVVIGAWYDDAWLLSEGLALVKKNGKWGYIDKTGRVVIGFEYDSAGDFSDGLTAVKKDGKWGYIDKTGRVVIGFEYDSARDFSDGLTAVKKDEKWGYIDKTGRVVIGFEYGDAWQFSEGLAAVNKNGRYGYINKTGRVVIDFEYDWANVFFEGLARVNKCGRVGYIDKTGRVVIGFEYDDAWQFSEGLAAVKKNDRVGYIDKTGRVVIGFEYDDARDFSDGLACIKKNGKWGYIDKTGRMVFIQQ